MAVQKLSTIHPTHNERERELLQKAVFDAEEYLTEIECAGATLSTVYDMQIAGTPAETVEISWLISQVVHNAKALREHLYPTGMTPREGGR